MQRILGEEGALQFLVSRDFNFPFAILFVSLGIRLWLADCLCRILMTELIHLSFRHSSASRERSRTPSLRGAALDF